MMIASNRTSLDVETYELHKLREAAKIASIYHSSNHKFVRNRKLSHVVHASLNFSQFIMTLFIEIFHHVHHYINRGLREKDEKIPALPEERNPIFFLYPICMVISFLSAIFWLSKRLLPKRPGIALLGCVFGALSMLLASIMEMRHADYYIDINEISDEELFAHPVFFHNFIMCILSIFVMTIYLIQTWLLFDVWRWIRKYGEYSDTSESEYSSESGTIGDTIPVSRLGTKSSDSFGKEQPGELDPIPELDKFPSRTLIDHKDVEDEPIILYCCFVDFYNYIKESLKEKPINEFQVIHVM